MKLLNHTLLYLSGTLLLIIGIWAGIFYFNMIDEIYDSIDDGLDNYKLLILKKAKEDSTVLQKRSFDESNYRFRKIGEQEAISKKDRYSDTLMYMENEEDYEPVRLLSTLFKKNGDRYELQIVSSMVEEDDLMEDLMYAIIWLYLAILGSLLLINQVLLRRIWRPFYELINKLKNFNLNTSASFSTKKTRVTEFNELNDAVQKLLSRNIEVYASQKQFIENASHEIQTPLAISLNKTELLMEDPSLTEEQLVTLSEITKSMERLTRLNKSLLLLSKIENKQFVEEEEIDFNQKIKEQLALFKDLSEYKQLSILINDKGHFTRRMSADLADILLTNLLKNAIIHNVPEGSITITITDHSLSVSNSSDSGALDPSKIFTRFYRAGSKQQSTGLGLSIMRTIAGLYGLTLSYSYDKGHIFTLAH